jgi:fatty acid desaturase (delta-4 desaturase)
MDSRYWYIDGRAYDFQSWESQHPGGAYILRVTRGSDCTTLFHSYHALSKKRVSIEKSLVRYRVDRRESSVSSTHPTPVYDELAGVVRAYASVHGHKTTPLVQLYYLVWSLIHLGSGYCWLVGCGGLPLRTVFGVSIIYCCGDLLHQGTHYCLCDNAKQSHWIGFLLGWLFVLPQTWTQQHVLSHHTHTNDPQKDPDLHHFVPWFHTYPTRESLITRKLPWTLRRLFLWYTLPVFSSLVPNLRASASILWNSQWLGLPGRIQWDGMDRVWGMLAWLRLVLLLSGMLWYHGVCWVLFPFAIAGCLFYLWSQVSHINEASMCDVGSPDWFTREWAVRQILATQGDYAYGSWVWTVLSLGLNCQLLHHLFPSIHWIHYPSLCVLIRPMLVQHGLSAPGYSQTFGESLTNHCRWLRTLNW